jgi:hypothetical protein
MTSFWQSWSCNTLFQGCDGGICQGPLNEEYHLVACDARQKSADVSEDFNVPIFRFEDLATQPAWENIKHSLHFDYKDRGNTFLRNVGESYRITEHHIQEL